MTEKTAEVKAPAPEVVEKALAKQAADDELNQREAKALEAQNEIDAQRGYRRVLMYPAQGIYVWQHIATQHTTAGDEGGEAEMRRVHLEYLAGGA